MMEILSSLKNPRVQAWRALKERKARRETGTFLIEGSKMLDEAIASNLHIECVLIQQGREDEFVIPSDTDAYIVPEHVLASICDTKTPQGVAAVVRMPQKAMDAVRIVALDGVQDPGNVGTIIRTADAAGFEGVLLSSACADVYSPKVLRATMGSMFHLPVVVADDFIGELQKLRQKGMSVISSQLDGEPFYAAQNIGERFCLVIGNEGNGVSDEVKKLATHHLMLPMRGRAESLNAAVAAGIMMYELMK